jgi:hypothetical protein
MGVFERLGRVGLAMLGALLGIGVIYVVAAALGLMPLAVQPAFVAMVGVSATVAFLLVGTIAAAWERIGNLGVVLGAAVATWGVALASLTP